MKMVLVKNGKVVEGYLPSTYTLNGKTISNYHLLDIDILTSEGWLPLEEIIPEHDKNLEKLVFDRYTVKADKVIKNYKVIDLQREVKPNELQEDLDTVAKFSTMTNMDVNDVAELLLHALQRIEELEDEING